MKTCVLFALIAAGAFHLAYSVPLLSCLIVVYLYCLFELSHAATGRLAFLCGLGAGLLAYAPQLTFFGAIFGPAALDFWLILAFWVGLFVVLLRAVRLRHGSLVAAVSAPVFWTGLEYFRSELYFLRFSWLSVGYAFAPHPQPLHFDLFGVYGIGFVLMLVVALHSVCPRWRLVVGLLALGGLGAITNSPLGGGPRRNDEWSDPNPYVVGVQIESASEDEVLAALDAALERGRNRQFANIVVLPEYTLSGAPSEALVSWCRTNRKYLIVGGKDALPGVHAFYNTAFVIGPDGSVVFKQAKSVPIQFFNDGLPAPEQRVWESPLGRIGICICYDLSYTRVTDRLVSQGAEELIVPTMDARDWGAWEHRLHARIAPIRAAEYRLPVIRVCSSGVSQAVARDGKVIHAIPYSSTAESMAISLTRGAGEGHRPLDRWLAPLCVGLTGLWVVWLGVGMVPRRRR